MIPKTAIGSMQFIMMLQALSLLNRGGSTTIVFYVIKVRPIRIIFSQKT